MKNSLIIIILFSAIACNQTENQSNTSPADSIHIIKADSVPLIRQTIAKTPAASFEQKVPDDTLNDWKFRVELFETKKTFVYSLRIQYKELRISDSIKVPDFGLPPRVALHKGNEPLSCIIGFLDKKGNFMEYRLVHIKGDQLKINSLKTYFVGSYQTPVSK